MYGEHKSHKLVSPLLYYLHRGKSRSHHKSSQVTRKAVPPGSFVFVSSAKFKKIRVSWWVSDVSLFLIPRRPHFSFSFRKCHQQDYKYTHIIIQLTLFFDWLTHQTQFYIILHTQSGTPTVTDLYSLIDAFSLEYKYENTLMKTMRVMKCLRTVFVNAFITMALFVSNQFSRPLGRRYHLFCQ